MRAAQYVSMDWLAHKLLDKWLAFELEKGGPPSVVKVFTAALALPARDTARLHTDFCEYISRHPLADMVSDAEVTACTEVVCL
jgi:hypothetical protein